MLVYIYICIAMTRVPNMGWTIHQRPCFDPSKYEWFIHSLHFFTSHHSRPAIASSGPPEAVMAKMAMAKVAMAKVATA